MTDDDRELIQAAMQKANGKIAHAAVLLGWPKRKLEKAIEEDEQLKAEWAKPADAQTTPPNAVELLDRDPILEEPATVEEVAQAINKVDQKLFKDGLEALGRTPIQVEKAMALQALAHQYFKNTVELMHGGMVENFLACLVERDERAERLKQVSSKLMSEEDYPFGSEKRQMMVQEEALLAKQMREVGEEIIASNRVVYQGALVLSVMRRNKTMKPVKLGFKPVTEGKEEAA